MSTPAREALEAPSIPTSGRAALAWWRVLTVDAARFILLALVGLDLGWMVNGLRREPLDLSYRSPAQRLQEEVDHLRRTGSAVATAVTPIELGDFQPFVAINRGLVIDARAATFYQQGHVPGALNLPRDTFGLAYSVLRVQLEGHKRDRVVVYCSDADCPDADLVGGALASLGFAHVLVYRPGWEEWTRTGLAQEASRHR
jgi:rhodanese-related sulfurtransferase